MTLVEHLNNHIAQLTQQRAQAAQALVQHRAAAESAQLAAADYNSRIEEAQATLRLIASGMALSDDAPPADPPKANLTLLDRSADAPDGAAELG